MISNATPRAAAAARRVADVLEASAEDDYSRFVQWCGPELVGALSGGPAPQAPEYAWMLQQIASRPRDAQPGLLDLVSYLPDDILAKVDRASMAVSLEVRAPLLDHRVAEFALRLPGRLKRQGADTKYLLRKMLYARVPQALVDRPKMGFGVPLADWFRGPLRARMDAHCASDAFDAVGLDPRPFRELWAQFKAGAGHRPDILWQAWCLAAWSQAFLSSRP